MKTIDSLHNASLICGFEYEARCLKLAGIKNKIGISGANTKKTKEVAERLISSGSEVLISIGLAGGLDPRFGPGSLILADQVLLAEPSIFGEKKVSTMSDLGDIFSFRESSNLANSHESAIKNIDSVGIIFDTDKGLNRKLLGLLNVEVTRGLIMGVDKAITTPRDKIRMFGMTGCLACDMESHVIAKVANSAGIPFIVLRVVCDPSNRYIPKCALKSLTDKGRTSYSGVIAEVCLRPWELPDLLSVWYDSRIAFKALSNAARMSLPLFEALR